MEIVGLTYASCIALISLWWILRSTDGFDKTLVTYSFLLKIIGTFSLQALFTYYYTDRSTADIYRFFDDGIILNEIAHESPIDFLKILFNIEEEGDHFRLRYFETMNAWIKPFDSNFYNDNHIMIKLNALMAFISFGYSEVHNVIFSIMAFVGTLMLIRSLLPQANRNTALVLSTLYPSSLLWLSGGLKETLVIAALGMCLSALLSSSNRNNLSRLAMLLVGLLILIQAKLYILGFLVPAIISHFISKQIPSRRWTIFPIWLTLCLGLYFIALGVGLDPIEYIVRKQHDFINVAESISAGSTFYMSPLLNSYSDVLIHIPMALINSVFRPFPWEVNSAASYLMVVENLMLVVLFVLSVYSYIKRRTNFHPTLWIVLFIVPILILIGLVTPVFGAIMRYRAPAILILIIFLTPYIQASFKKVSE